MLADARGSTQTSSGRNKRTGSRARFISQANAAGEEGDGRRGKRRFFHETPSVQIISFVHVLRRVLRYGACASSSVHCDKEFP